VVIHQDDVGMCHGANTAFVELARAGVVTSGSVMVPCPWFTEIAELASTDADLDLGVHLTLTSEKAHYRWRPISGPPPSAGLTDPSGHMWRDVASVRRHADPAAVEVELRAQIEAALDAGIDVTHLDAHMGAVIAPELCHVYLRLGADFRLPILLTGTLAGYGPSNHLAGVTEEQYGQFVARARQLGQPIFDEVRETPWDRPSSRRLFSDVADGLTFLALHPNAPGDVEEIEPDTAHIRIAEYVLLRDADVGVWLGEGAERIGMRRLRDELRGTSSEDSAQVLAPENA
jgi:chitin disaccharide deacetylase